MSSKKVYKKVYQMTSKKDQSLEVEMEN